MLTLCRIATQWQIFGDGRPLSLATQTSYKAFAKDNAWNGKTLVTR